MSVLGSREKSNLIILDVEALSVVVVGDCRACVEEEKMYVDGGVLGSWPPTPSYDILVRLTCSSLSHGQL